MLPRAYHFAILGLFATGFLSGCQQLIYGEPSFNTGILLPDQSAAARDAVLLHLKPLTRPRVCDAAAPSIESSPAAGATKGLQRGGPPAGSAAPTSLIGEPSTQTGAVTGAAAPDAPGTGGAPPVLVTCVTALIAEIDDQYREYRIMLHHFADQGNAVADIAVLGLTTAATSPVSIAAKTIFSGIGTVIGGSKSILNQDLLYKQTIEILINQMDADRENQLKLMLTEMNGSNYTYYQAMDDLLAYFADGTWDHAIVSLQTTVAAAQASCKAQTDAAKVRSSGQPANTVLSSSAANPCPSSTQ